MRLVIFGPIDIISSPRQTTGGIVSHTRLCVKELAAYSRLYILTFDDVDKITCLKKGKFIFIIFPRLSGINAFFKFFYIKVALANILKRIRFDKAIIQAISYYLLAFPRIHKKKVFVFVHGIMFREYSPIRNKEVLDPIMWFKWFLVSLLELISSSKFDKFIIINNEMKSFFSKKRTFLLRNQSLKEPLMGNQVKKKIIICVGNIIPRKRQKILFDAFHKISPEGWKLIFIGRISNQYAYDLVDLITQNENVKVLSNINDAELEDLLMSAQIFCLPSASESSPISILEAMDFGCKIIASNVGGLTEMREQSCRKNDFHLFISINELENLIIKTTSEQPTIVHHNVFKSNYGQNLIEILYSK